MEEIERWRKTIDEIDARLVALLNERGRCAIEIGKIKKTLDVEIYDPRREEDVIRKVTEAGKGPLSRAALRRLFERIIDESRRAEKESSDAAGSTRGS